MISVTPLRLYFSHHDLLDEQIEKKISRVTLLNKKVIILRWDRLEYSLIKFLRIKYRDRESLAAAHAATRSPGVRCGIAACSGGISERNIDRERISRVA